MFNLPQRLFKIMNENSDSASDSTNEQQKTDPKTSTIQSSYLIPTFYQNLFATSQAFHQSFLWNQAFINAYKMYNSVITQSHNTSYLRHYSQVFCYLV